MIGLSPEQKQLWRQRQARSVKFSVEQYALRQDSWHETLVHAFIGKKVQLSWGFCRGDGARDGEENPWGLFHEGRVYSFTASMPVLPMNLLGFGREQVLEHELFQLSVQAAFEDVKSCVEEHFSQRSREDWHEWRRRGARKQFTNELQRLCRMHRSRGEL